MNVIDGGPIGIGNSSRNWKSVTVTECESEVNVIAYQGLEGKAAAKLYAGSRMAARLGIGNPSRNWKFVTVIECESDVNVIVIKAWKGRPSRSCMQAAGRRPEFEIRKSGLTVSESESEVNVIA